MRLRNGLLAILAVAAFPASASAAPDFTATMSGASPVFTWEGTGTGVTDPLGAVVTCAEAEIHYCQNVLFNVEEAGDLSFTIDSDGDQTVSEPTGEFGDIATVQDIDTYLYPSDAAGEIKGDSMSEESASVAGDEAFTMKALPPGYYLLQIEVFNGVEASWTGKAELTNVAPKPVAPVVDPNAANPTPPPAPAAEQPAPAAQQQPAAEQPAPAAQPAPAKKKAVSKKAACQKKAKKIKNKGKRKKALKKCAKIKK